MWFFCFELGLSPKRKRNSRINKSDMLVICLSERKGWARICIGHTFFCLMRLHEYRVIPATINVPDRLCILMHVTAVGHQAQGGRSGKLPCCRLASAARLRLSYLRVVHGKRSPHRAAAQSTAPQSFWCCVLRGEVIRAGFCRHWGRPRTVR